MITLLILIITFLLLILAIIWGHFLRSNNKSQSEDPQLRDQTNIQLYQEHKSEIEKDFQQGAIDEESYQYLLTELDKSFLQDMTANEKETAKISAATQRKLSPLWPVFISLFVLIFSVALYQKQGSYLKLAQSPQQATTNNNKAVNEEQQALTQIKEIKQALKKTPDSSNLWYSLGQANINIGNFNGAVKAFDKVLQIEGNKPDIIGAKAQALYYANKQKINTEVQTLIDQALALDPLDPSTNVLLGMDSFINQHYQKAIRYWQKIVDSGREDVNAEALKGAIAEAQSRLTKVNSNDATDSPKLTLNVSLSEKLQQALAQGEDKIVFVYAIPADGRRMPLAAMKIKLSDLPITINLTDAQAMSPQFNLSSAKSVHIFAVASQQGRPGIKSGDYKAELKNIAVNTTTPLNLIINQLVP
ncbi:MAG: c-type cytochrome biogenesis protein CcmI [Gammaproteobacteria bacterium]|nr:MAG: c-type cytochrome biogenesis protein CcmI [Gammaproteobacteria bacterium]